MGACDEGRFKWFQASHHLTGRRSGWRCRASLQEEGGGEGATNLPIDYAISMPSVPVTCCHGRATAGARGPGKQGIADATGQIEDRRGAMGDVSRAIGDLPRQIVDRTPAIANRATHIVDLRPQISNRVSAMSNRTSQTDNLAGQIAHRGVKDDNRRPCRRSRPPARAALPGVAADRSCRRAGRGLPQPCGGGRALCASAQTGFSISNDIFPVL